MVATLNMEDTLAKITAEKIISGEVASSKNEEKERKGLFIAFNTPLAPGDYDAAVVVLTGFVKHAFEALAHYGEPADDQVQRHVSDMAHKAVRQFTERPEFDEENPSSAQVVAHIAQIGERAINKLLPENTVGTSRGVNHAPGTRGTTVIHTPSRLRNLAEPKPNFSVRGGRES